MLDAIMKKFVAFLVLHARFHDNEKYPINVTMTDMLDIFHCKSRKTPNTLRL